MYKIMKKFSIACSHRLHDKTLSDEKNKEIFGKCNNLPSHGHNYIVEVHLRLDYLNYGMVRNFNEIKKIFKENIYNIYDHQFLNDISPFDKTIPTVENMAKAFCTILRQKIPDVYKVRIYETDSCYGEWEDI